MMALFRRDQHHLHLLNLQRYVCTNAICGYFILVTFIQQVAKKEEKISKPAQTQKKPATIVSIEWFILLM